MKLHVLGSAGYHPNDYRQTTCLMIPELGVVFDAGTGFYRVRKLLNEVPAGMPVQVLLSHGHSDHTVGLEYGINVLYGTGRKIEVFGQEAHLRAVEQGLFDNLLFPLSSQHPLIDYRFRHWRDGERGEGLIANATSFKAQRLPHPGGSTGFRLSLPNGKDLAYITDTCADDVPLAFVEGVDTLVHECNFTDDLAVLARNSGHSTTSQVFNLARRAGVRRLVLIHWNTLLEIEAGMPLKDMTGRDPNEKLPFELVLSDDHTIVDL